jgi:hypothetical protein
MHCSVIVLNGHAQVVHCSVVVLNGRAQVVHCSVVDTERSCLSDALLSGCSACLFVRQCIVL